MGDLKQGGIEYASRGVILVTCNYRVGVLGFLCPQGGDANCGLWDQVAVLNWVRTNIKTFGGDPGRVTIVGQSAGADSVYWLCSSKVANRLFCRAIMMSPSSFTTTPAQAHELAREFAELAGAKSAGLADLQDLEAETIINTQAQKCFRIPPNTGPGWRELMAGGTLPDVEPVPDPTPAGLFRFPDGHAPVGWPLPVAVVDGELLEDVPMDALAKGVAKHLDII